MTANAGALSKSLIASPSVETSARVLVADPDEDLQSAYRATLEESGYLVDSAVSGIECVARLRDATPDLLVIEPELPWGGGDGVLAVMEEVAQWAAVPVLVLTACRDPYVLQLVAKYFVNDFHLKPLSPKRLAGRIQAVLKHPRLRFAFSDQSGRLKCSIDRRTDGRVRELSVESMDGRVIVRGRSRTHYIKQLALAAVNEALRASDTRAENIELDITVG